MSGHSHWATIKRKKEAEDIKRGKIFSKFSREITVAAKDGSDARLRLAIDRAKTANMPKSKIDNAVKKGTGEGKKGGLKEIIYEGFGPQGVGIIVEALTDNRKRTTAELRKIFEKGGGSLGGPGTVSHQFKRTGLLVVAKGDDSEETVLKIMDLGVEDVEEVEDAIEVYTRPQEMQKYKQELTDLGLKVKSFNLVRKPLVIVQIKDKKTAEKTLSLMNALEDYDDVQRTDASFDIEPDIL